MLITIKNEVLQLKVDTMGAQMRSIQTFDGKEYLWQGDPDYWEDQAPVLFPFIGRLTNDSYQFNGMIYPMGIHGFAAQSEFIPVERDSNRLVLSLSSNEKTLQKYPFEFLLEITFELQGKKIAISYRVTNKDDKTMPFGIGGHPGFRVPIEENEEFEDYMLEFSQCCQPDRIGFTPAVYLSGHDKVYPLKEGKYLPLKHELFNKDAVILKNMAREVTLKSKKSSRSVTISYPDMPYLGIWHWPYKEAPYVCIEPWTSLPARQDIIEEFSCKSDLIQLSPGKMFDTIWTISIA